MRVPFNSTAADRDPERSRSAPHRPRGPRTRRARAFRGRVESLEGRALLTFGTGGIVTGPLGQAYALAIQPADQKIVVGGDRVTSKGAPALVRYNTDGTLDSTFGSGGVVTTSLGETSVVAQGDGRIVVGGSASYTSKGKTYSGFAMARYNANGSLDTSFGSRGEVITSFPSSISGQPQIQTLLQRQDGEYLAVGSNGGSVVLLALYKPNGALDTSFGSSGTVVDTSLITSTSTLNSDGTTTTVQTRFLAYGADYIASDGALESDNSILVSGTYSTETQVTSSTGAVLSDTTERDLALVHYLPNGARDLSFGNQGILITRIAPAGVTTSNALGSSVLVQPDGTLLEVGSAVGPDGNYDIVLARYNANGTPDTTFGGGAGYTLIDMGTLGTYPSGAQVWSFGDSAALQANGQTIIAGTVATGFYSTGHPSSYGFATVRLNADGSLDPTFGTGGAAITQVLYNEYDPVAVGLETINDQTMIVEATRAMVSSSNATQEFALVRYTPSGRLDSGTAAAAATGALPTRGVAMSRSIAGTPTGGSLAGTPMGLSSAGFVVAVPAVPSILPVAGLVPQALDSPGFFDTLLPGGKRR